MNGPVHAVGCTPLALRQVSLTFPPSSGVSEALDRSSICEGRLAHNPVLTSLTSGVGLANGPRFTI